LYPPHSQHIDIRAHIKVYISWIDVIGQAHELTCPGSSGLFQCPLITEAIFTVAELFIGASFTAIALALGDVTSLEKDLTACLMVQLQYGTADRLGDSFPLYPSQFPLFPNVNIRATLAMTHLQSMTNENIAGLGLKKVGRDYMK